MAKDGVPGWDPDALRVARRRAGWTQQQLAERTQLSRSAIAGYERPGFRAPSPGALRTLAQALGCSPEDFLCEEKDIGLGALRARLGLSQGEFVERLNLPDLTAKGYQGIESGRTRRLRHANAEAIARVLGISVEEATTAHAHDVRRRDLHSHSDADT